MTRPGLVLPGPRRSQAKRRRVRYVIAAILALIAALGWFGYRQLFSATAGWFTGP